MAYKSIETIVISSYLTVVCRCRHVYGSRWRCRCPSVRAGSPMEIFKMRFYRRSAVQGFCPVVTAVVVYFCFFTVPITALRAPHDPHCLQVSSERTTPDRVEICKLRSDPESKTNVCVLFDSVSEQILWSVHQRRLLWEEGHGTSPQDVSFCTVIYLI